MLIGIISSPRRTDERLAQDLQGRHYFTHLSMQFSLDNALESLYGHRARDHRSADKMHQPLPFAGGQTFAQLREQCLMFLESMSGEGALRRNLEAELLEMRGGPVVVTGLGVHDAGWLIAQGGQVVLIDDALEELPEVEHAHHVFRNERSGMDAFQSTADTLLEAVRRHELNVISKRG